MNDSSRCWKVESSLLDWKHWTIFTLKYSIFLHLLSSRTGNSLPRLFLIGNHSFFSSRTKLLYQGTSSRSLHKIMFWAPWSSWTPPVTPAPFSAAYTMNVIPSLYMMFWAHWSSRKPPVTHAPFSASLSFTKGYVFTGFFVTFCHSPTRYAADFHLSPALVKVASNSVCSSPWTCRHQKLRMDCTIRDRGRGALTRVASDSWLSVAGSCLFFLAVKVSMRWMLLLCCNVSVSCV